MSTVREATFELLRARGMTTIFGNPGSTELPMLGRLPRRLPLRARPPGGGRRRDGGRLRAGVAAASATSTSTPRPASATRWGRSSTPRPTTRRCSSPPASRSAPLMTMQANLTNREATRMPHPLVKWSYEPPRAADVPAAIGARDPHRRAAAEGPGVRLDPDGRLGRRGRRRAARGRRSRARVDGRAAAAPDAVAALAERLAAAEQPGARRRARHRRVAAAGTTPSRSPSASDCRSGRSPRPAAAGSASRRATRNFQRRPAAGDRRRSPRRSPATT